LQLFCDGLSTSVSYKKVLQLAQSNNFFIFDFLKEQNKISVLNHRSPFFRYACRISFKEDKVFLAKLFADD